MWVGILFRNGTNRIVSKNSQPGALGRSVSCCARSWLILDLGFGLALCQRSSFGLPES